MYSEFWYTSPSWDPEYKRYQILAIDSFLRERIKKKEWFPFYPEISSAKSFLNDVLSARDSFFPKEITGIDLNRQQLTFSEASRHSDSLFQDGVWEILEQSFVAVSDWYDQLKKSISEVAVNIQFSEIGVHTNYFGSGILFVPKEPGVTQSVNYSYHFLYPERRNENGYLVFHDWEEIHHSNLKTWQTIKLEWMEQTNRDVLDGVILAEGLNNLPLEKAAIPIIQMELPKWLKRKGG